MGTIIAINGKGGTGKTTIAALVTARLISLKPKSGILAIDADPNSCFADALGIMGPKTIVGICDEISKNMYKIPSGMTKDRYIEMEVQEAVTEKDDFDLLVMGRPEGPGCYCYVNNLLRNIIEKITKNYDFVVIDNAAGMEHISRRTMGDINKLLVVSDYSVAGVRAAKRIYALAVEMGIRIGTAHLVINKVSGPLKTLEGEIKSSGLVVAGCVPYSDEIVDWNISNRAIFELKSPSVAKEMETICKHIIGERDVNRVS